MEYWYPLVAAKPLTWDSGNEDWVNTKKQELKELTLEQLMGAYHETMQEFQSAAERLDIAQTCINNGERTAMSGTGWTDDGELIVEEVPIIEVLRPDTHRKYTLKRFVENILTELQKRQRVHEKLLPKRA